MRMFTQGEASLNELNQHMHPCLASSSFRLRFNHSPCYNSSFSFVPEVKGSSVKKNKPSKFSDLLNEVQRTKLFCNPHVSLKLDSLEAVACKLKMGKQNHGS